MNGTPHYVTDAAILVLATVRYLWGPATDLTRLGLMVCAFTLVLNDMSSYYQFESFRLDLGRLGETPLVKILLALFIAADLLRDYLLERKRQSLGNWAERKRR